MKINRYIKGASAAVALLLAGAGAAVLSGCDAINDDLPPCPEGVALSFRYEYNMEFANAFPAQVDCLTLLVYDEEGKNIATRTETTSVLADEHYRMVLDLPAGHTYSFVAYGGIACPDASFHFAATPGEGSDMTALRVAMDPTFIDAVPGRDLHPLFYGRKSTVVRKGALDYTNDTVYMLKDTNTIRVILQNVDGTPVDPAEFNFTLTANNTLMAWDNALIPTVNPNYLRALWHRAGVQRHRPRERFAGSGARLGRLLHRTPRQG